MNDFFYSMEGQCDLYNYADDNTLSFHAPTIQTMKQTLENAANIGIKWFNENGMQANPQKFQGMILGTKNDSDENRIHFQIDDITIKPEKCVKLLGVYIDDNLKFQSHVSHICKQAAKQISVLRRFSKVLNEKEKLQIFNTFIMSNFNYCPLAWHLCGPKNTDKMEKIQERALRFVYNDHTSSYAELLTHAKRPSLYLSRLRKLSIEVYKIVSKECPDFLHDMFMTKEITYNLRDENKVHQPKYNSMTYGYNSLRYQGAKLWNLLPSDLKQVTNLNQFKTLIKAWLGPPCSCSMCSLCKTRTPV